MFFIYVVAGHLPLNFKFSSILQQFGELIVVYGLLVIFVYAIL